MKNEFLKFIVHILLNYSKNITNILEDERPILAHYTTLEAFEKIILKESFLLSSPVMMNDRQEVMFGLSEGMKQLNEFKNDSDLIEKLQIKNLIDEIISKYESFLENIYKNLLKHTFVLCFSEHDAAHYPNGKLSMWRGYGANGEGVAITFDTKFLSIKNDSSFLFCKVKYGSDKERKDQLKNDYLKLLLYYNENKCKFDKNKSMNIGENFFTFTFLFSLINKNVAFEEENEWRLICFQNSEFNQLYKNQKTYQIKNNSIHPKLEVKMQFTDLLDEDTKTQEQKFKLIIRDILLGPSHSSQIALEATKQMLTVLKKDHLIKKLVASDIPYRPHSSG